MWLEETQADKWLLQAGFRKHKDSSEKHNSLDPKHCCQPAKNNSFALEDLQPASLSTLVLISFERPIVLLVLVCFLPQGLGEAGKVFHSGSSSIQIVSKSEITGKIRTGQRLKASFVSKTEKTENSYHWHIADLLKTSELHWTLCKFNQSQADCNHLLAAHTAHQKQLYLFRTQAYLGQCLLSAKVASRRWPEENIKRGQGGIIECLSNLKVKDYWAKGEVFVFNTPQWSILH